MPLKLSKTWWERTQKARSAQLGALTGVALGEEVALRPVVRPGVGGLEVAQHLLPVL